MSKTQPKRLTHSVYTHTDGWLIFHRFPRRSVPLSLFLTIPLCNQQPWPLLLPCVLMPACCVPTDAFNTSKWHVQTASINEGKHRYSLSAAQSQDIRQGENKEQSFDLWRGNLLPVLNAAVIYCHLHAFCSCMSYCIGGLEGYAPI